MLGVALVLAVHVAGVADVASPRPGGWVTDQAHVLDAPTIATLNEIVDELHRARGIEIAVVTVDDVPGTPKAFATELFNTWHIGTAGKNDGVLVLLVMGKRRLEIETGTGIEPVLPAAWLAEMQAREMVPAFKRSAFPQGLVAGVRAVAAHVRLQPSEAHQPGPPGEYRSDGKVVQPQAPSPQQPLPAQPVTAPTSPPPRDDGDNPLLLFGSLGMIGAGGTGALALWTKRRRRRCAQCKIDMTALDEQADDAHLSDSERAEERVGSVDYEVLVCSRCNATRTLRHGKWFSGYSTCSGCKAKTLRSWSRTISAATTYSEGQVEVNEQCAHCNYQNSYIRTTARLADTSSSSSSSDSSSSTFSSSSSSSSSSGFSGGSSSGGGAGSSW
jgi:uncharacterized protein